MNLSNFLFDKIFHLHFNKQSPFGFLQTFGELVLCTHCLGGWNTGCTSLRIMVRWHNSAATVHMSSASAQRKTLAVLDRTPFGLPGLGGVSMVP